MDVRVICQCINVFTYIKKISIISNYPNTLSTNSKLGANHRPTMDKVHHHHGHFPSSTLLRFVSPTSQLL
jgi:hypothetical protein